MPIQVPGKRYGKRLRKSRIFGNAFHAKKSGFADLLITPLVDMFVIIVLFLMANFSATGEILNMSKDIKLPSAREVEDLQLVPVVMVSKEHIVVDAQPIGRIDDLMRDEMLNIAVLEDKLREKKKTFEDLHALAGDGRVFEGHVNIQADKDVSFGIIKRVMYSCSSAGYANINFAVQRQGDESDGAPTAAR
ncbi:MAG: ExbD/TolR family protein [Myxococcaceae bacterium]